jgi:hypothetical protein
MQGLDYSAREDLAGRLVPVEVAPGKEFSALHLVAGACRVVNRSVLLAWCSTDFCSAPVMHLSLQLS